MNESKKFEEQIRNAVTSLARAKEFFNKLRQVIEK